jgi:uncharacterized membrane protein (UPF0127 family)
VAHWLSPLVRDPGAALALWHPRTGQVLATRVQPAFDSPSRRRGLLGRTGLDADEALILAPCSSIHTAFMRFPIDVAFVDRSGRILKLASGVRPWQIRAAWRSFSVVELASGTFVRIGCRPADELALRTIV